MTPQTHVPHSTRSAVLVGTGMTPVGKLSTRPTLLMRRALELALARAGIALRQVDGLIAIPSLADPHFMEAHYFATQTGLLPRKDVIVRTIDTGGAGPVTGLIEAARMIEHQACQVVAVVAGDAVSSLPKEEFLRRADQTCRDPEGELKSPVIVHAYDRVARWQMDTYGITREQLAMCSVLMSRQAHRHPLALTRTPHALAQVLDSPRMAPVTHLLECARRADGGAAIVVASSDFLKQNQIHTRGLRILGGGECSGPLYPPPVIDEDMFSCEEACAAAYQASGLGVRDIDFFGLYDCYPICLIRAIEAVGICAKGEGGAWVQAKFEQTEQDYAPPSFPINTHGGLLAFGA
ncbi:MAG TPA: thiolase family protein, partial [Polyangiaceae bacterium]|nr:thiolase family protein [Polyangiaceae bacterium]